MSKDFEPIFDKPYGPSQRDWGMQRAEHELLCEMCGNEVFGSEDMPVDWTMIGDRQLVDSCCGKLLDDVYESLGEKFVRTYLANFAQNPTALRFSTFRGFTLPSFLEQARDNIRKTSIDVGKVTKLSNQIKDKGVVD